MPRGVRLPLSPPGSWNATWSAHLSRPAPCQVASVADGRSHRRRRPLPRSTHRRKLRAHSGLPGLARASSARSHAGRNTYCDTCRGRPPTLVAGNAVTACQREEKRIELASRLSTRPSQPGRLSLSAPRLAPRLRARLRRRGGAVRSATAEPTSRFPRWTASLYVPTAAAFGTALRRTPHPHTRKAILKAQLTGTTCACRAQQQVLRDHLLAAVPNRRLVAACGHSVTWA